MEAALECACIGFGRHREAVFAEFGFDEGVDGRFGGEVFADGLHGPVLETLVGERDLVGGVFGPFGAGVDPFLSLIPIFTCPRMERW